MFNSSKPHVLGVFDGHFFYWTIIDRDDNIWVIKFTYKQL
jgi:hypothetical protein